LRRALFLALVLAASSSPAADAPMFQVTPWAGFATARLGALEGFAKSVVAKEAAYWHSFVWGESMVSQKSSGYVDIAFHEGLDIAYLVDPLVRVIARFGYMRTMEGGLESVTEGGGSKHVDNWSYSSELLLLQGGAGFTFIISERARIVAGLALGPGWATVRFDHRYTWNIPDSFEQASAEIVGTGFFPEFTADGEYDLAPSITLGARAGWRFGAVQSFTFTRDSKLSYILSGVESKEGEAVRDGKHAMLIADYGGLTLDLLLSYKF